MEGSSWRRLAPHPSRTEGPLHSRTPGPSWPSAPQKEQSPARPGSPPVSPVARPAPLPHRQPRDRARPGERLATSVLRQCKQIISVCLGGGGRGGTCLELCYVLKKKAKNLGHKPQTVLLSAPLAQTGIFSVVSGRPRPGLAGLGGERPEAAARPRPRGQAGRGQASRVALWPVSPRPGLTGAGVPPGCPARAAGRSGDPWGQG